LPDGTVVPFTEVIKSAPDVERVQVMLKEATEAFH
jgi:hypothetical protein